ncbi:MAG: YvcK family protein, partial [Anaerolineales bacterium]|nr:YvcK family protein [Anaerolineales bacterium]
PFVKPGSVVVDTLTGYRRKERGPKIVVIGGGHGLATLLRGLKEYSYNLTAVVTVADDGGSSGRLRESLGILPPGDIRNCLAALSSDEEMMTQLFQYRFPVGNGDLEGHSFGNLFISAISEIVGSFEDAIAESGRVLAVHGKVMPATLHDVKLVADILPSNSTQEVRVKGESLIPMTKGRIRHIWLEPNNPPAYPSVVKTILNADLIVIGPGSLYTSILPNLLVPDVLEAIRKTQALKIYVCNVATQPGETDGYTCKDHINVILEHCGDKLFDLIVANNHYLSNLAENMEWVFTDLEELQEYLVYQADLLDEEEPWHHSSEKISRVLIDLLQERTGPLTE